MFIHLLETALPVFAALLLGVLCREKKLLSREGIDALKRVAVDLCLPAVVFAAFAQADYTPSSLYIPVLMFLFCLLAFVIGCLMRKAFKLPETRFPFLMTGFEAGMLGYGLYALLYPGRSNSVFAILDLGQVLFVFTYYKLRLAGKGKGTAVIKEALTAPVLWGIAAGLVFGLTGLFRALEPSGVSGVLTALSDFISAPTGFLILITVGYDLTLKDVAWGRVLSYVGLRAAVMLLIYGGFMAAQALIPGMTVEHNALLLMLILPAPYVLPVFSDDPAERGVIASTLSVMTVFTLVLFGVMAAIG